MRMKVILVFVLVLPLLLAGNAYAQKRQLTDTSFIDRAHGYTEWSKTLVKKLQGALEQARKERNSAKIDCIEKRLVDMQKISAQIEAGYRKMRRHSLNKEVDQLRQEFALVDQKRKIVEQLVDLVNDCLGRAFEEGFFTEVIEELPLYDEFGPDPTATPWEELWPEPLPPVYAPRPASLANDE
jgi:hypothetical protein